jgi:glycosyltransferase involved in cell wall biosynthesis
MRAEPRVAFVTDSLPSLGGAEKVLFAALDVFPGADVFTLIYNRELFASTPLASRHVKTSILDRVPLSHAHHRTLLPLMPAVVEQFDLRQYDLVVSFSYAVAHGVRVPPGVRHVSYTYTPMRYAWSRLNLHGRPARNNLIVEWLLAAFRSWDRRASSRINEYAAVSQNVACRIGRVYQREARVLYPPVEVDRFEPRSRRSDYYVTISRLVPHKRVDVIVEAFTKLGLPLIVIGEGPELVRLQRLAGPNIRFAGYLPDPIVEQILGRARAFVSASEEDFGIAMVEAQAAGCPVIAYGKGGALETVINGRTGLFFAAQTAESLKNRILSFESGAVHFEAQALVENARRFEKARFTVEFANFVLGGDPL